MKRLFLFGLALLLTLTACGAPVTPDPSKESSISSETPSESIAVEVESKLEPELSKESNLYKPAHTFGISTQLVVDAFDESTSKHGALITKKN